MARDLVTDDKPPMNDGTPWPWLLGTVIPLLAVMFLFMGHDAIDRADPDTGAGAMFYLLAAAAGTGAVVLVILRYPDHMQLVGLLGGLGALVLGTTLAAMMQDSYGLDGIGLVIVMVYFIGPAYFLGYAITLLVLGLRMGAEGLARACAAWGLAGAGTALVAGLYHLLTLNMQARLAREAHEASAMTVVAALVVLGAVAAAFRRSKC